MNILSIEFISMLMMSGMMVTLYRNSKSFHSARVLLTVRI